LGFLPLKKKRLLGFLTPRVPVPSGGGKVATILRTKHYCIDRMGVWKSLRRHKSQVFRSQKKKKSQRLQWLTVHLGLDL
jgi:hypothetical protein